jgi:predicted secreted protein
VIDWITCKITVEQMPRFGIRVETDDAGCIVLERDMPKLIESHETSVFIVPAAGMEKGLLVSGNPTKWLQGHNVYGIDSWRIVEDFLQRIAEQLQLGAVHIVSVSRLDVTYSVVMPSEADVQAALTAIANTTADRWGRPVSRFGTVYFGSVKRLRLVCYSKAPEYRRHMSRKSEFYNVELPPILRLEARFGRNWFDENDWNLCKCDAYRTERWNEMVNRIRINELETLDISTMPRRVQKVYGLWVAGVDLHQIYSRASLYRYAKELRGFGIDIWAPYLPSNVIHLRRVLSCRPLVEADCSALGLPIYKAA